MTILLVESQPDLRAMIRFFFESEYQAEVYETDSSFEATQMLDKFEGKVKIDCVVSSFVTAKGTGADLRVYLSKNKPEILFVLCSSHNPKEDPVFKEYPVDAFIEKPWVIKSLRNAMQTLFEKKNLCIDLPPLEYCKIDVKTLVRFGLVSQDLYLKLNDKKFIKVFRTDDVFDLSDLKRFELKHIDSLYLKKEEASHFLEKLSKSVESLNAVQNIDASAAFVATSEAMEIVHEFSRVLGFSAETTVLMQKSINLVVDVIRRYPDLEKLFQSSQTDANHYLATHSVTLSYVACGIASLMGWVSETTFRKLTFAAFMHDLTLSDAELAKIQTLREMEDFDSKDKRRLAILSHPEDAARLSKTISEAPPDTDIIILEHHERPGQTGFPRGLEASEISPLSAVFIIAHELIVFQMRSQKEELDLSEFLEEYGDYYSTGPFSKVIRALTENVIKS